ncbi:CAZyme family GH76 [Penicillium hispanicum]|uniref:CAZyme family GH76 n=1 Tax=Penicillium hispanicum TaxID=1080232 RepID=UPI0025422B6F|nr:CAZyme family GH76 [Penicillium hispanicum]KAJ5577982.1 CAZyme family GH76 [Penicillium hispanicum]
MLLLSRLLVLPSLTPLLFSGSVLADDAISRAQTALDALQKWYNATSGIWDTCGWWNGANCMTVIADLAALDPSVMETATYVFNNTYFVAPAASNPNPGPEVKTSSKRNFLPPRAKSAANASEWLDSAYDDDGWWALAWIAAYDVTQEPSYLKLAEGIFSGLTAAWGTRCGGGGLPWNPTSSYVNAITNELFLSVAAHLANRVPSKKSYYVNWAQKEWNWFAAQGFIASNNTINDGLLDNCQNNGQTVWSYNQGVVLGGLVELNRAAPNATYLESANKIAKAAIETLADSNMVIHDVCEPDDCEPDATQFKGIFIRNLQMLQSASPNDIYKKVINNCAASIWENDRNSQNQLSVDWAGPFHDPADPSTHSSAMDALVAAIAV